MGNPKTSQRIRFWLRLAVILGLAGVSVYFFMDATTPKLVKVFIAVGLIVLLLYAFLGGGGGKGGPLGGKAPPIRYAP